MKAERFNFLLLLLLFVGVSFVLNQDLYRDYQRFPAGEKHNDVDEDAAFIETYDKEKFLKLGKLAEKFPGKTCMPMSFFVAQEISNNPDNQYFKHLSGGNKRKFQYFLDCCDKAVKDFRKVTQPVSECGLCPQELKLALKEAGSVCAKTNPVNIEFLQRKVGEHNENFIDRVHRSIKGNIQKQDMPVLSINAVNFIVKPDRYTWDTRKMIRHNVVIIGVSPDFEKKTGSESFLVKIFDPSLGETYQARIAIDSRPEPFSTRAFSYDDDDSETVIQSSKQGRPFLRIDRLGDIPKSAHGLWNSGAVYIHDYLY